MNVSAVTSSMAQIVPQQVSPAVLNKATNDGDGRTGQAALNDGDAAAQAAAQSVSSSGQLDVRA